MCQKNLYTRLAVCIASVGQLWAYHVSNLTVCESVCPTAFQLTCIHCLRGNGLTKRWWDNWTFMESRHCRVIRPIPWWTDCPEVFVWPVVRPVNQWTVQLQTNVPRVSRRLSRHLLVTPLGNTIVQGKKSITLGAVRHCTYWTVIGSVHRTEHMILTRFSAVISTPRLTRWHHKQEITNI